MTTITELAKQAGIELQAHYANSPLLARVTTEPQLRRFYDLARQDLFMALVAEQLLTEKLEAEIADLHTTMMAAVEIQEQWEHHCDAEGYGPANLMHRLERGIASKYGYDAKTMVRQDKRIEDLEAENDQLRKERQAFKDVTEYQASEIVKLRKALERVLPLAEESLVRPNLDETIIAARAALGENK